MLLAMKMEEKRPLENAKGKKTDFPLEPPEGMQTCQCPNWKTTDQENSKMIHSLSIQATKIVLICYSSSKELEYKVILLYPFDRREKGKRKAEQVTLGSHSLEVVPQGITPTWDFTAHT